MESSSQFSTPPRRRSGLFFGIGLILVGAILLAINFGSLPQGMKSIIFSWQMLLIVIGIFNFRQRHQVPWGITLISVGTFFIIPKLSRVFPMYFPGVENFTATYWPLLLIFAGIIFLVFRYFLADYFDASHWKHRIHQPGNHSNSRIYGSFEKNSVFGSGEHIILDEVFKGGEINAVFGGITLDLRRTNLPEGDSFLEVNAVFGGVTLYIPGDWTVVSHVDAVFGGFEDRRRIIEPQDGSKRLIIKGACVFGGGEIIG